MEVKGVCVRACVRVWRSQCDGRRVGRLEGYILRIIIERSVFVCVLATALVWVWVCLAKLRLAPLDAAAVAR